MVRRVVGVLFVGILIVASMYLYNYLTTSDRLSVTRVEFAGLSRVEAKEFDRSLEDLLGQNLLLVPLEAYEERLEMHPRVERVDMRRVLPNRVACTVVEREPVALVYTDRFQEVDAHGMVMAEDDYTALLDLPIITGIPSDALAVGKVCEEARLRNALYALKLCKAFGGDFARDISELRSTPDGVSIRSLRNDCVLVLGDGEYEKRLKKYFLLKDALARSERPARLIDLRFDDQVVLRGQI